MFEPAINLSDNILENLRCYVCSGYLSSSPIRVLPNGSCICGRCLPVDKSTATCRIFALEAILNNVVFPCPNRVSGCKALIHFNRTIEHESKCIYYTSRCPINDGHCAWEGSGAEISEHFLKHHNYLLQSSAEFTITSNEDSNGIFLTHPDNLYIVKYDYDAKQKMLWYDVRYCKQECFHDLNYTIQILNSNHPDCTMYLKGTKCYLYNSTFFAKDSSIQLNINQFYQYLDEPRSITIAIHFKYTNLGAYSVENPHFISSLIETLTESLDIFFAKVFWFYREYVLRHSREIIGVMKTILYLAVTQVCVSRLTGGRSNKSIKRSRNF